MNINLVKEEISKKMNSKVIVSVFGLRNRVTRYEGIIYKIYPNLFTVLINGEEKSFTYGDLITGDVYFAAPSGALCALLDRVFYAASTHGGLFKGKPVAAVASCIRSGANSTVDRINKYFSFSEMPIVSSSYWNMLFDSHSPVGFDERGHKTMQTLGYNMAAILQKNS